MRNYLEATALFDHELGLLLERLKEMGVYDNTLVVIASDHNDYMDDNPRGRPSIDPDGDDCLLLVVNAGAQVEGLIGHIDVFPTILDLMGLIDNQ